MKVFVVLSIIALAVAKPQGYSYNQPGSDLSLLSATLQSSPLASAPLASAHVPSAPLPSAPLPSAPLPAAPLTSAPLASAPLPSAHVPSAPLPTAPLASAPLPSEPLPSAPLLGLSAPSADSIAPLFSAGSVAPSFAGQSQPQALIQKHIYVHVPPQEAEEEEIQQARTLNPVQQQIHYKIIFIKAPSQPSVSRQQIQQFAQPQTEEKTLVYVLTKKDDSAAELAEQIQQAQVPLTPSKPEVYFIKYKTDKSQQQQIDLRTPVNSADNVLSNASADLGSISTTGNGLSTGELAPTAYSSSSSSSSISNSFDSGSAENSLPIPAPQKPAAVYGPAQ